MADIRTLTVEGTTYNIKDATARGDITTLQTNVTQLQENTADLPQIRENVTQLQENTADLPQIRENVENNSDDIRDLKSAITNTNKYIARRYYAERGQVNTSNQESDNNAKCRTEIIDLTKVKKIITNIPSTLSLSAATVKVNGSWVSSSSYIHVNRGYIWFEDAAEAVRLCYTHKNGDGQALTDAEIDALYMYQYIDLYENYDTLSASVASQFSRLNDKVIPLLYDPQVQVIDSGNDYNVYDAAVVNTNGGTKAFENNYLKWVTPSADAGNSFNITLYGTTATMVSDKYNNPYVASVLTFEFDYYSDATTAVVYCKSKANDVKSALLPTGTGHAKLTFDLASVNNLNITCTDKTVDLSKTIKIKNLILYYGTQDSTPIIGVQDIPQYSKFLAIGDSLTNGCLWQPFAARMLNVPVYTRTGGSGGTIAVSDHAPIYTAIQSLTSDLGYDLITLWGGTNDWTYSIPMGDFDESLNPETRDVETFYGALVGCVETLATLYPTARLVLIGTTPRASRNGLDTYHNTTNSLGLYLENYVNAVENVAKYYGCPFLDLLHTSGINEINLPDWMVHQDNGQGQTYYLHFNQWATEKIGRRVGSFIKELGY